MFAAASPNPTKAKHVTYLCVTMVLGILLSILAHVGLEAIYLAWAERTGRVVHWYAGCAMHPVFQIALPILGAVGGYFLGRFWWRWVYVERKWAARQ